MGDVREMAFSIAARRMTASGFWLLASGVIESATALAPKETKKEKKIHAASAAKAEVATLLKIMENRMDAPSQNER